MQSLSKKGISGTVGNVVLVLLAITAVWIFSLTLNEFLSSPSLSPGSSCLDLQFKNHITIESACYNSSLKEVNIVLKRDLEEFNISSLGFVIGFSDGNSRSWRCESSCLNCKILDLGNRKKYYFDVSDFGVPKEVSLLVNKCGSGVMRIRNC